MPSKKSWIFLFVLAFTPAAASAQYIIGSTTSISTLLSSPTEYDNWAAKEWSGLKANPNFHMLDNATVGYCYDAIHKVGLGCATTSLYQKYYISADFGVAGGKIANQDTSAPSSYAGFPIIAGNFHAGQLLKAKVSALSQFANQFGPDDASILNNATVGVWGARDFGRGQWCAGGFASFKWGAVSN